MRSGTTSGGHIVAYTMFWFMLQRMCFVSTSPQVVLTPRTALLSSKSISVAVQFIHTSPPMLRKHSSSPVVSSLLVLSGIHAPWFTYSQSMLTYWRKDRWSASTPR